MSIEFPATTPPTPPDELIDRVTTGVSEANAEIMREGFRLSGQRSVRDIEKALAAIGADLEGFSSVLEFGCGCGRILLWLESLGRSASLHGTDIDADAIAWNRENMPWATFGVNDPEPPLPYADGQFDLVFNHSVLTHLDERLQDLWLAELRRITKPGGLVLLTTHGEKVFEDAEHAAQGSGENTAPWRVELESRGILFVDTDSYTGSTFPDFYHTTFHAPWYVFEHWSAFLTVRAYIPRGDLEHQDIVLLERTLDDRPIPARPVRARPAGIPGGPPATVDPSDQRAVERAEAAVMRAGAPLGPSRFGGAGDAARRGLYRLMKPYFARQHNADRALLDSVKDLDARAAKIRMPPLVEEVLGRQAERVGRLERALSERIDEQDRRIAALEDEG